ncbi:MAG: hypothetical protein Q4D52_02700 [Eubacteriales bacterium]|nr:hypothetical protein [Eubacteriales bacterium]
MGRIKDMIWKRPMLWVYGFSLLLEIPIIAASFFLNEYINFWIIGYGVLSLIYYYCKRKEVHYEDRKRSIWEALKLIYKSNEQNSRYDTIWSTICSVVKKTLILVKYIGQAYFAALSVARLLKRVSSDQIMELGVIIVISCIMVVLLLQLLFEIFNMNPLIPAASIIIIYLVFSQLGFKETVLGWQFVSLVLLSIIPGFLGVDFLYLCYKNLKGLEYNENEAKKKILEIKYQILLAIPFLYIALSYSEKITTRLMGFLKDTHFWPVSFEILLFAIIMLPYIGYRENILHRISIAIIKSLNNCCFSNGKYIRVKYEQGKWIPDIRDYVYFEKKSVFISEDERANFSTGKPMLISEYLKNIDIKTEEVFCIEDRYYVNSHSKLLKKLEEMGRDRSNKSNLIAMEKQGLKILNNKMDPTLWFLSGGIVCLGIITEILCELQRFICS